MAMTESDPSRSQSHQTKDGTLVSLRPASEGDAEAIALFAQSVQADGEGVVGLPDEGSFATDARREWIADHQEVEGWLALLAELDGAIVGLATFEAGRMARLRHQGELGLWVAPDLRSKGIGTVLLSEVVGWARGEGIERVALTVVSTAERAIGLYRKFGFVEEGRRVREVKLGPGEYADQLQMALFVEPA